jgi:hypothetical protein
MRHPFTRLISLGKTCQCAHQLRRFVGTESASYFDWLGTPHAGLILALKSNFGNCFLLPNLEVRRNGETVIDSITGISHRHNFRKIQQTEKIDASLITADYPEQRKKMQYLACKWFSELQTQRILFVRHDAPSAEEAGELLAALTQQNPTYGVNLLFVVPPEYGVRLNLPGVFVEHESVCSDWPGDDESWSKILGKYWHDADGASRRRASRAKSVAGWDAVPLRSAFDSEAPVVLFHTCDGDNALDVLARVAVMVQQISDVIHPLFLVEGLHSHVLERMSLPFLVLPQRSTIYGSPSWNSWAVVQKRSAVKGMVSGLLKAVRPVLVVLNGEPSIFIAQQISIARIPSYQCVPSADVREMALKIINMVKPALSLIQEAI